MGILLLIFADRMYVLFGLGGRRCVVKRDCVDGVVFGGEKRR